MVFSFKIIVIALAFTTACQRPQGVRTQVASEQSNGLKQAIKEMQNLWQLKPWNQEKHHHEGLAKIMTHIRMQGLTAKKVMTGGLPAIRIFIPKPYFAFQFDPKQGHHMGLTFFSPVPGVQVFISLSKTSCPQLSCGAFVKLHPSLHVGVKTDVVFAHKATPKVSCTGLCRAHWLIGYDIPVSLTEGGIKLNFPKAVAITPQHQIDLIARDLVLKPLTVHPAAVPPFYVGERTDGTLGSSFQMTDFSSKDLKATCKRSDIQRKP